MPVPNAGIPFAAVSTAKPPAKPLEKYVAKRNFSKTPEPSGAEKTKSSGVALANPCTIAFAG